MNDAATGTVSALESELSNARAALVKKMELRDIALENMHTLETSVASARETYTQLEKDVRRLQEEYAKVQQKGAGFMLIRENA